MKLTVIPYEPRWEEKWDRFVMEESANGCFLQTRRFLNYHPADRFEDCSLLVLNGEELCAVVPLAARMREGGKRMAVSHPGSTFGGPVVGPAMLRAPVLVDLLEKLDEYLAGNGFDGAEWKPLSPLFCSHVSDGLDYAMYHAGYTQEVEIACQLPLKGRDYDSLRAGYSFNKRYDLKKCEKAGLTRRMLSEKEEIAAFYTLLCRNLEKFDARPVHTLAELEDFFFSRLSDCVRFLGVFDPEGTMVAGSCLFVFSQTNVLHTQYLAVSPDVKGYVASTALYDSVIRCALEGGFDSLSFGTSTHDRGRVLNTGLIQNKEGYGSVHSLNRIYTKYYTGGGNE